MEGNPFAPQKVPSRRRWLEVLRWLCVPFAAWLGDLAGYLLGGTVSRLAVQLSLLNPPNQFSERDRAIRYLLWMVPAGILCIVLGAKTAPHWRRTTAVILAAWWILIQDFIHHFTGPTLYATLIGGALGLAIVFYFERQGQAKEGV